MDIEQAYEKLFFTNLLSINQILTNQEIAQIALFLQTQH